MTDLRTTDRRSLIRKLFDVFPCDTPNNPPDNSWANTELSCQLHLCDSTLVVTSADSPHVVLGQRCVVALFALLLFICRQACPPSFFTHISVVIRVSAQKKMIRANTTAHIATVQDTHPFRDCAIGKCPCHP